MSDLGDEVLEAEEVAIDPAAPAPAVEDAIEADLGRLQEERDEFRDTLLRLQADFQNYKRRTSGQLAEESERGAGKVVEALLPVLDACDLAMQHGSEGVEPIWTALIGTLEKQGLELIVPMEQAFDPAEHEAVVHEPGEGQDGSPAVSAVLRPGYRWKGRVLRPAMVKVRG